MNYTIQIIHMIQNCTARYHLKSSRNEKENEIFVNKFYFIHNFLCIQHNSSNDVTKLLCYQQSITLRFFQSGHRQLLLFPFRSKIFFSDENFQSWKQIKVIRIQIKRIRQMLHQIVLQFIQFSYSCHTNRENCTVQLEKDLLIMPTTLTKNAFFIHLEVQRNIHRWKTIVCLQCLAVHLQCLNCVKQLYTVINEEGETPKYFSYIHGFMMLSVF